MPPPSIISDRWRAARPIAADPPGIIAGEDPKDTTTLPGGPSDYLAGLNDGIRGLRIGYDPVWAETAVDEQTVAVVKAARLGATIVEIKAPDSTVVLADWIPNCAIETAVAHEQTYPSRKSEYGPALSGLIETGRALNALDYQKILLRRAEFKGAAAHMFQSIDLLLVPAQSFAGAFPSQNMQQCSVGEATI